MLVLSRKIGEQIVIGDNIRLTVVAICGDRVRLGLIAPAETPIRRTGPCASQEQAREPRSPSSGSHGG